MQLVGADRRVRPAGGPLAMGLACLKQNATERRRGGRSGPPLHRELSRYDCCSYDSPNENKIVVAPKSN